MIRGNSLTRARGILLLLVVAASVLGIAANLVNIVVFTKQGLRESINVSLLGLSISDMATLVALIVNAMVAWYEEICSSDLPIGLDYLSSWVYFALSYTSCWIAVFILVERCLCVTFPLKVKGMITPKVSTVTICVLVVVNSAPILPPFFAYTPIRLTDLFTNITIFILWPKESSENSMLLGDISIYVLAVLQQGSFLCLVCSSLALVLTLKKKSSWRSHATANAPESGQALSQRDARVVKMVITVCVIILVNYLLGQVLSFRELLFADTALDQVFWLVFKLLWAIVMVQFALNAGINIFVYYHMSSKYKNTFRAIFRLQKGE